ncbi:SDR family NAD(P)-dependent oxidoreductase [Bryobacter aggregatus]|uniref:SDR family NAD(P)-dependent oxidoreductase n=1 Tax=Bryobacter aggregatus TaxID=360054 RepID=UPI0004E267BA|nr:SDR family NAD(P)-dependent oxidoreductase [Bryobacter aggregatus]
MASYFDLTGQTAIVTGAAAGIGEVIARRLANSGATVVIADLNVTAGSEVAASLPNHSFALSLDVASSESCEKLIADTIARTGRVDILVNNAGVAGKAAPIWEQTNDDWALCVSVNLNGPFYLCRAVLPHMRERKYGRIVNIASIAGKEGNPNMSAYSATKAGLIGFTKSLGKEVAQEGICANCVTPAVVRTKMLEQLTPAQVDYMTQRIPMRRTGEPEEIAAVVHFLASPDASFVTAQTYDASGGRATY